MQEDRERGLGGGGGWGCELSRLGLAPAGRRARRAFGWARASSCWLPQELWRACSCPAASFLVGGARGWGATCMLHVVYMGLSLNHIYRCFTDCCDTARP